MNIGTILVRFGAETSGLIGGIRGAIGALGTFGAAAAAAGVVVAGLAIAIGVVSVAAAANFQQGMNRLVTGAGNVTDNMKTLGQGILGVSVATGTLTSGTNGLLASMYLIDSAGQRGSQSLDTLKAAAQGAKIEQASLSAVTQILTTLQTDFGLHTYTATQYMNGLVAAVSHGKITLEDLSTAMSPILPSAKELGIHFADVAGAMSDMTNQGIPAAQAATALRFVMQSMILPTKASQTAMKEWGLDTNKVAAEMKVSLPGAIQMYIDAAKRAGPEGSQPFIDALAGMMGGGQRAAKALFALSQSMGTWKSDIAAVNTALRQNSADVMGWSTVQGNFNLKADQAKAALEAMFITIGTRLLPVLTQIVGAVIPIIQKFADWVTHTHAIDDAIKAVTPYFNAMFDIIKAALPVVIGLFLKFIQILGQAITWVSKHKEILEALMVVAKALGIIIVGVLAAGLLVLAVSFAACAAVIIVVIAVVAGLIEIWKLLVVAANWVAGAWNSAIAWLVGAWHTLVNTAVSVFNAIKNAIVTAFNATIAWLVGAWNTLVNTAVSVFNGIKNAIVTAFNATIAWLVGAWNSAIAFIVSIWNTLRGAAVSVFNAVRSAIMTAVNAVITWLVGAWNTCVQAVVAAFTWLYNHNYYWQWLVDTIRTTVQAAISWLQTAWQNCIAFIVGIWNTIRGVAASVWGAVSSTITSIVNAVISWLRGAWASALAWLGGAWNTIRGVAASVWGAVSSTIISIVNAVVSWLQGAWASALAWLGGAWNTMRGLAQSAWDGVRSVFAAAWGWISGILSSLWASISGWFSGTVVPGMRTQATSAWQGVSSVFSSAWGTYIAGPLSSLAGSITGFFSNLAGQMVQFGRNLIQGIVDGINSMLGAVAGAAGGVANTITSILGFHSPPPEGPARDSDTWMPNMVTMMTSGVAAGIPQVKSAVSLLLQPLQQGNISTSVPPVAVVTASPRQQASAASDTRPIIIHFSDREIVRALMPVVADEIRIHFGGR